MHNQYFYIVGSRSMSHMGTSPPSIADVAGTDAQAESNGDTSLEVSGGVGENVMDAIVSDAITPNAVISPDNDYELDENVAVDLVKYVQSNTIRNEEQFLLLAFAYISGLSEDTHDYISSVTIGTSSSGKTHLKDKVDDLFHHLEVMEASTGSDKVLVYDEEWDDADIISMGELQQPSEEMLEFMKRAHGGDEEVIIRSTRGNPSQGFHSEKIVKKAKSYHFTYAQMDADFEFWNRMLKIPVHESETKNRAVGRMAFGHEDIDLGDGTEYGNDFDDGVERLQAHMLDVKRHAPGRVVLPNGGANFDWDVWEILKPIFNHSRSESNRVYQMIANLVKGSARLNFQNRETIEYTVASQGETGREVEKCEAIVAEPQDVANVVRCLETLRATTHEIGPRKRAVVEAIKTKGSDNTVEGLEPIVEFLEESDASEVKQGEIEVILDDLEDNHLITRDGDTITARNWDALGEPQVEQNSELFESCVDPVSGSAFLEGWQEYRQEASTMASDLLETPEITSSGADEPWAYEEQEQEVINDITSGDSELELEPWQGQILARVTEALDGERVRNMGDLPEEAFVGIVSHQNPDMSTVETRGTILDPTHEIWDQDDKPDEWVVSETKARQKIQQTITELVQQGIVQVVAVHEEENGKPVDVTIEVDY